jgi:excisionase family DNA binding protein
MKGELVSEPIQPLPELIDITSVAKVLGVDARHVRRLVYERRIPFVKWGHLVRFDPVEIRDWLNSKRRPAGLPAPVQPPVSVRSLPRRRPAQAEPSDPSPPQQMRLDP